MQTAIAYLRHELIKQEGQIKFWQGNLAEAEKAVIKCRSNLIRARTERIELEKALEVLENSIPSTAE